jgi:two-component system CheB/CheR fusion protein
MDDANAHLGGAEKVRPADEGLQPLNEELATVNAQLRAKMAELEKTNNDLSSLLSSTDIAVIFLDSELRLRRFTPAARALIDLVPSDIGRPLHDLATRFTDPELGDDADRVLERLIPIEREVGSRDGRWFMRRLLPYRTTDGRIEGVVVTFVDITRHRAAETAQRHGEVAYHQTIQNIRDHAIIMLDTHGVITAWSTGAVTVLGFAPEEMIGRNFREIFVEEDREADVSAREMEEAAATGIALDERWHRRKNGGHFWASGTVNALRDDAGRLTGFVKILRDHTAQKELTEKLDQARYNAELANRSKGNFIAMISHELRTHLSIIMMWSKMLREDALEGEDLAEAIEAIGRSAESQSRLIEDLLDSSRIAAGKLSLEIGPADLGELVTQVADSFWPAIESKGIECVVDVDDRVGVVECDGDRIRQVVRNLISNAVKFTPQGGRIEVSVRRDEGFIEMTVSDTGMGIEPEFLPRVFELFTQSDSARDRAHGGLGLGLSICKTIAEMHGGLITPFSDGQRKGARFVVRLPLHATAAVTADRPGGTGASGAADSGRLDGRRVLLIEDQPDAAVVIGAALRRAGAEVSVARNATEGLERLDASLFDLIVSDIGLPDFDGFEFIKRAREAEKRLGRNPAPAVALTAYGGSENHKHALKVGFDGFLVKPSDPEMLLAELGRLINAASAVKPA